MRWSLVAWAPPLQKWHQALNELPHKHTVLPELSSMGQLFLAWQGDKLLGAAAARAVEKATDIRDPGDATRLLAKALSNRFFASHANTLLPDFPLGPTKNGHLDGTPYSQRQLGSMLEATVAQVSASSSPRSQSNEAISELAEWLIETANEQSSPSNPKGAILEIGGTVDSIQRGGPPHQPVFEATAKWRNLQVVHVGHGSKKSVGQQAAAILLTKAMNSAEDCGFDIPIGKSKEVLVVEDCRATNDEASLNPGSPWILNTLDGYSFKLRDGESPQEWWSRGALTLKDAFRRAWIAPHIFDKILRVDCWSQKLYDSPPDRSVAAFSIVSYRRADSAELEHFVTPIVRRESVNKAKGAAGVEANQRILEIVWVCTGTGTTS